MEVEFAQDIDEIDTINLASDTEYNSSMDTVLNSSEDQTESIMSSPSI